MNVRGHGTQSKELRMPNAEYTVDHVDPRGEVTVTAVRPLGPGESRHEQITAPCSVDLARRARALRGQRVHLHVSTMLGHEVLVDILPASPTQTETDA